jgi:uncharacterized protein (DUF1800 family)
MMQGSCVQRQRQFLRKLAVHPATATNICAKMIKHFISSDPYSPAMQDLLKKMVKAWLDNKGDLKSVYTALATHTAALARSPNPGMKDPETVMVSAYRSLGMIEGTANPNPPVVSAISAISANDQQAIYNLMLVSLPQKLGMHLSDAPSVQGWATHSDTFWKNPGQLNGRLRVALELAAQVASRTTTTEAFNRVIGSNTLPAYNSRSILLNNDTISALASIVMAPEFQLT